MKIRRAALAPVLALALGACTSIHTSTASATGPVSPAVAVGAGEAWVVDRMYFGRDIPGGGSVSDEQWMEFLSEVVTPLFPAGLTSWRVEGQWRGASDAIVREPSYIVELIHAANAETDAAVQQIAAEYKRRFNQEAVMRVRVPADVVLHEE